MGIYDREYLRRPSGGGGFGGMRLWSMNTWLIVVNAAVFFIEAVIRGENGDPLFDWGYFSLFMGIHQLQLWRLITYQFLHANVSHIFWNMLALYFFGPMVEDYLGPRRYLAFYLSCGIAGGLMFAFLSASGILHDSPITPLIGASAGIYGVLLATGRIAPDMRVQLIFPPIPMTMRTMALGYLAIAVFTAFSNGANAGGEASHVGGGLWGLFLIGYPHWLNFALIGQGGGSSFGGGPFRRKPRMKVKFHDWTQDRDH